MLNQGSRLNKDLIKVEDVKIIEKSYDIQTNYCQSQKSNGNININLKSEESHSKNNNPFNRSTDIRPNLSINNRPQNISISIDNYNHAGDIETKI